MPKSISFWEHPIDKIEEALSIRKQIAALQSKLGSLFPSGDDGEAVAPKGKPGRKPGKRVISAESRARMAAAQRARWTKNTGEGAKVTAAKPAKRKGKMSAEARARISAAAKKRWAERKAQG